MRDAYPSETRDRFMVRLPDGMREKIGAAAKASSRTMNAEIIHRLSFTFGINPRGSGEGEVYPEGGSPSSNKCNAAATVENGLEGQISELRSRIEKLENAKNSGCSIQS